MFKIKRISIFCRISGKVLNKRKITDSKQRCNSLIEYVSIYVCMTEWKEQILKERVANFRSIGSYT